MFCKEKEKYKKFKIILLTSREARHSWAEINKIFTKKAPKVIFLQLFTRHHAKESRCIWRVCVLFAVDSNMTKWDVWGDYQKQSDILCFRRVVCDSVPENWLKPSDTQKVERQRHEAPKRYRRRIKVYIRLYYKAKHMCAPI